MNEKVAFASHHSIPVVSSRWFFDSLRNRKKQPLSPYRLDKDIAHNDSPSAEEALCTTNDLQINLNLGESFL